MALTAAHFRLRASEALDLAAQAPDSIFSGLLREIAQSYQVLAVNEDWRESRCGRVAHAVAGEQSAVMATRAVQR